MFVFFLIVYESSIAASCFLLSNQDNPTVTLTVRSYEDPTHYYNMDNITVDDVEVIEKFLEGKEKGTNTFHIKVNETIPNIE